jgi:hypothetical protein
MTALANLTQATRALLRNSCTGNCQQGRTCTCGQQPTWATTSDPLAWVHIDGSPPQAAEPADLLAAHRRDLVRAIAAVATLAVLMGLWGGVL